MQPAGACNLGVRSAIPDAPYHLGPFPADPMRFVEGPPTLAVEVRSEGDYTRHAQQGLAAKRADDFEAGTSIVWDVDPIAECIHVYRAETPDQPATFGRGHVVDAGQLLPGLRIAVDWIFPGDQT